MKLSKQQHKIAEHEKQIAMHHEFQVLYFFSISATSSYAYFLSLYQQKQVSAQNLLLADHRIQIDTLRGQIVEQNDQIVKLQTQVNGLQEQLAAQQVQILDLTTIHKEGILFHLPLFPFPSFPSLLFSSLSFLYNNLSLLFPLT